MCGSDATTPATRKVMGADVAASPHCPCRGWTPGLGGEAVRVGRFREPDPSRGLGCRSFRSPSGARGSFRFPRWLPVRAEALAVRRSADPKILRSRLPPPRHRSRSSVSLERDPSAKASGSARQSIGRSLWAAASQLPGRSPVLPDQVGAEAPSRPVAVRGPKSRCCRTDIGPKPRICLVGSRPEPGSLWALYETCRFRIR